MWKNFLCTGFIFLLCSFIFYITIEKIDPLGPQQDIAYFSFFVSYFFGIVSFFTFLFFFSTEWVVHKKLGQKAFFISIRRGILVGFFASIIAVLQIMRLLDWFGMIMIGILLILIELMFLSTPKKQVE